MSVTDVERLAALRCDRTAFNTDVKPVDLLRAMAHDIESGKLKCDGLLLIWADRPTEGDHTLGTYRCNMTRDQEISTLVRMQYVQVRADRA